MAAMNSQRQKMKMQQKLTPQQLLLMRLLQLPVTSLEQRIKEEVEKNPMLEIQTDPSEDNEQNDAADNMDEEVNEDFHGIDIDEYYDDDDYSYRERLERDRNTEERQIDFAEGISFPESLMRQLRLHNLTEREYAIGDEIIGSIDGTGYLGRDIQLIANDMAFRSGIDVTAEEVEQVLKEIQMLDPAGVGARNLQECLSLQLHRIVNPCCEVVTATKIVDSHFGQLTSKHYSALMASLKIDEKELDNALSVIRRLNPKPGWGHEEENKGAHYIVPDFIVSREGGVLTFTLSDRNRPKLNISSEYSEMLQELSTRKQLSAGEKETVRFIKTNSESARWLIDTLDQRQQTLTKTMEAIMQHQKRYFMSGDSVDLQPMRLREIAAETGYDESTISRVVNQKYVQTDFGTFPLKELFSKAVVTNQGEVMASEKIKEALRKVVKEEDKRQPLTDEALAKRLQEMGFALSRRTVTKYRESMGIPVGRLRKELNTKK